MIRIVKLHILYQVLGHPLLMPQGALFFCVCALPLRGGPRPDSEWGVNGTPWALFETQCIEALPKCIQLKYCAFYALSPLYIIMSLKQHAL